MGFEAPHDSYNPSKLGLYLQAFFAPSLDEGVTTLRRVLPTSAPSA